MSTRHVYFSKARITLVPLNAWDLIALGLIFAFFGLVAVGTGEMAVPFHVGEKIAIHLEPSYLPQYALRSVLRMFFALMLSFLFTFTIGTLAAKSRHAGRFLVPMIDVLQSVPILGFLSITVVGFIQLFRGSLLGPECAAIFVIFTSQVWNITLSFYQSIRTVPSEFLEVAKMYRLSKWQQFWRIEVPFAMPSLLWNTMMSMSASWFFVVASEAITVSNQDIKLPGIGSYIAVAIDQANIPAVIYAIISMFLVILCYDQLIFRPLILWAEKFKLDGTPKENTSQTWLIRLLQKTHLIRYFTLGFDYFTHWFVNWSFVNTRISGKQKSPTQLFSKITIIIWYSLLSLMMLWSIIGLLEFIIQHITLKEIFHVFFLGCITTLRVFAVIIFCSLVWVPIGVWIGFHPQIAKIAQPLMQFFAAFPAYLLFPIFVIVIVKLNLNAEIWITPLLILGTQWYVAFNVIAGAKAIPKDLHLAIQNFHVKGHLKWQRFIIPAIFPYYITAAITASGGAWNTSIVAEVVSWGTTTLTTTGLGAYIVQATHAGDYPRIALGIAVMCLFVLSFNRALWRPLYHFAEKRFRLDY